MEFGGWFLLIGMDYFCDCLRTVLEALITYKFVLKKKNPKHRQRQKTSTEGKIWLWLARYDYLKNRGFCNYVCTNNVNNKTITSF